MEMPKYRHVRPFTTPAQSVGNLDAEAVANLIASAADVALLMDTQGVIKDVSCGTEYFAGLCAGSWLDRPWVETVMPDSRHKVLELLGAAASGSPGSPTRWREINHEAPSGGQLPFRYSALRTKNHGNVIALGQSLKSVAELEARLVDALHSNEADYARIRRTELRYRLMFQIASEATLIVEATSGRVVEANGAAWAILGSEVEKKDRAAHDFFSSEDTALIGKILSSVAAGEGPRVARAHLTETGIEVFVSASSFLQNATAYVLLRLLRVDDGRE
jgi:transcriptional regulator PpsR